MGLMILAVVAGSITLMLWVYFIYAVVKVKRETGCSWLEAVMYVDGY